MLQALGPGMFRLSWIFFFLVRMHVHPGLQVAANLGRHYVDFNLNQDNIPGKMLRDIILGCFSL